MPSSRAPTVRQRRLGAALRQLRDSKCLSSEEVGEQLGWSASKISRLETARIGARISDIRLLLELYGVDEHQRGELLALAHDAAQRGWWVDHAGLSAGYAEFIALEHEADSALYWSSQVVPGLFQTEDYARRVIAGASAYALHPPPVLEGRLRARLRRQRLLRPPRSLHVSVVLDESVLLRRIGDNRTMAQQLSHLVEIAKLPNVTLRVLPLDGDQYPVLGGDFILLAFSPAYDVVFPDVVHTESVTAFHSHDQSLTHEYRLAHENLAAQSHEPQDSLALISQTARDRWRAT
jgi:transcriptional regulator with XRE-family HTH domain